MFRLLCVLAVAAALMSPAGLAAQSCTAVTTSAANLSREEADREAQRGIDDARRLGDDFHKCRRLALAIAQTRSATTANSLFSAAGMLRGDFELAEVLIAASRRGLLEPRTATAFFEAALRIRNDYQLYRVLSSALPTASRSPSLVPALLRASTAIGDDYQLATLLLEIAEATPITGDVRELYLVAARTLQSGWEYGRAIDALPALGARPATMLR